MKELTEERLSEILTEKLDKQTIELKAHAARLQEDLARMVNDGFEDMRERLDITEQLKGFDRKFQKLEEALHIKL